MRDLGLSYEQALHGVQSATAYEQERGSESGSPKHLRVGINALMSDASAIASLLIEKGIITEEEYLERLRLAMNEELSRHQDVNAPVTFR